MTGATDVAAVHLERDGILSGAITFARRYSHSPVETAHLDDFSQGLELLLSLIKDNGSWGDVSFVKK